jgi:hypothetical protein
MVSHRKTYRRGRGQRRGRGRGRTQRRGRGQRGGGGGLMQLVEQQYGNAGN